MGVRSRSLVGLVAVVTAVLLWLAPAALSGEPVTGANDGVATSATVGRAPIAVRGDRTGGHTPDRHPLTPLTLVAVLLALVPVASTATSRLIGRRRRRLGDVGETWRSLLVGAPPALA